MSEQQSTEIAGIHAFDLEDGWCLTHRAYCDMGAAATEGVTR